MTLQEAYAIRRRVFFLGNLTNVSDAEHEAALAVIDASRPATILMEPTDWYEDDGSEDAEDGFASDRADGLRVAETVAQHANDGGLRY